MDCQTRIDKSRNWIDVVNQAGAVGVEVGCKLQVEAAAWRAWRRDGFRERNRRGSKDNLTSNT